MEVALNLKLHKVQQEIHESSSRFKAIDAGKRFGKTEWSLFELIQKAHEKVGEYWYIGPTYKQAKATVWRKLLEMIPKVLIKGKPRETALELPLVCGSSIFLKGSDDEDTLRGPEIDGVVFDERSYQSESIWPRIIRGQISKRRGFAYFISSPNWKGKNHWTKFCNDVKRRMVGGDVRYYFRHCTIYDNTMLPIEEIEEIRGSVPTYIWDLEYMAKESEIAGQLYSEFNFDRDIMEMKVEKGMRRFRFLDHGLEHPMACLWSVIDEERMWIYVYDEYVRAGCTISQNCSMVKEKTGEDVVEWSVMDPSTARRDPITKKSYMFEYSLNGVPCIAGERTQRGVDLLKMCIERGRIKVHPKCKTLIYQLQNVEYGDKEGDDAVDALKYGVAMICDMIPEFRLLSKGVIGERVVGLKKGTHEVSLFDDRLFNDGMQGQSGLNWLMEEVA